MTELGDDPILPLEIPKVNVLCQDLGFIDKVSQKKFRDSVTKWRKGYRTASGKWGTTLLDWDSDVERYDLGVMAQQFVETRRNLHDFWPSDKGSSAQVRLRYPNDKVKILQLLRRFMWRQNKYLARNRRNGASVNGARSGSEEYFPPTPPPTSQLRRPSQGQVMSRLPDYRFIPKDRSSYGTATGLRANSAREMAVGNRNWHRLPGPKPPALPESIPAELDSTLLQTPASSPGIFHPGDANSTLTTGSSGLSLTRGSSANNEKNTQSQSLRQKRSYPRLSISESESNKRRRISMPSELQITSYQTLASGLEASNDLDNQRNHSRRNVQLSNSDSPQSQTDPATRESSHSTTAQADPHTPAIRPEVNVLVVECSGPRVTIKKWPGGTLKGRTLKSIFDEVSSMFSEQTLQTIKFQLQTLKKENAMECLIGRDDDEAFEFMMQKFNERIRERIRAGEARFKLVLEAERRVQGATEGAVGEASGSEENYV